jgi:cobalamin synthase
MFIRILSRLWQTVWYLSLFFDLLLALLLWLPLGWVLNGTPPPIAHLRELKVPVVITALLFATISRLNHHYFTRLKSRGTTTASDLFAAKIYAVLALPFFPVGTVLGLISLMVLSVSGHR